MTPRHEICAPPNPGLPGFARFWGCQISHFGSQARLGRIDAHWIGDQKVSYRKVYGLGSSDPVPEERSLATRQRSELEAFLQESSPGGRSKKLLEEQNAQNGEGDSMPGTQ